MSSKVCAEYWMIKKRQGRNQSLVSKQRFYSSVVPEALGDSAVLTFLGGKNTSVEVCPLTRRSDGTYEPTFLDEEVSLFVTQDGKVVYDLSENSNVDQVVEDMRAGKFERVIKSLMSAA